MIFPKDNAVYQNLNTSFTNFAELLVDLKENSFTGCVQISYWEYEGVLLLDNGSVVNAVEEMGGNQLFGPDAAKRVTARAREKDGSISVFALSGEMVTMLASVANSEIIYENLSTEFTSLEALITKLRSEDHTGYIEVDIKEDPRLGYIFLLAGRVIESLITSQGEEISGANILPRIVDFASTRGATFSVYRSAVEQALEDSEEIMVSFDLPQLLVVWQHILAVSEAAVDRRTKPNHFLNTYKETLIEIADEYPFLDPFAAKFQYQNGEIKFTGEARKNFSQGLAAGLLGTLESIDAQLADVDLLVDIRAELGQVKQEHSELIERFNLGMLLPGLLV